MKKVLGLDLGTTSIGWALVNQADSPDEKSSIIRAGVRVNPLSVDEKDNFEKGKDVATNSDRTLKRAMRRNLQRYKLRRDELIKILKEQNWIDDDTILAEHGNRTTFETYRLRAEAVKKEVSLPELARILLMINKKRGYKSSRKVKSGEDGKLFDGMAIAKILYDNDITPGQYGLSLLKEGKKHIPDFYRSDLKEELRRILDCQSQFYPEIIPDELLDVIDGKGKLEVSKILKEKYGVLTADNKGKDKKLKAYTWRAEAVSRELGKDELAYVIVEICGDAKNSSGYLGAISDRSKELIFNDMTVGQALWRSLCDNHNVSLKNITFYRQDYLDEFERIWTTQENYHKELTPELKKTLRDVVIFYQRRLKSQKGLISKCEFEKQHRVAPRSSLLFQEFKIWQCLNNLVVTIEETGEERPLSLDEMNMLAGELFVKDKLTAAETLKLLFKKTRGYKLNFRQVEGNRTVNAIVTKLIDIVNTDDARDYDIAKLPAEDVLHIISTWLAAHKCNEGILSNQNLEKIWHLLYSYEGDKSRTGNESLVRKLAGMTGLPAEYAAMLAETTFEEDYGSLSARAIRKILPYMKEGNRYDAACIYAGYNHSHSETSEDLDNKVLKDHLDILPKNSLRNPVVEKILNQMINVVNTIADEYGKPDEIHIEMARELQQDKNKRAATYSRQLDTEKDNKRIEGILKEEFGFSSVRKSDILRYKLYEELKPRGYKTLYSNQYIPREKVFSKEIDIEHIIPQSVLFNDSYANKTLEYRAVNIEKGDATAKDYILSKYGADGFARYKADVEDLYNNGFISGTKTKNLLMAKTELPEDFLLRDLTNSQYIARKARQILGDYVRVVLPTSGSITAKLREDWQLVDVMKELNMPKYDKAGMTYYDENIYGDRTKRIQDWTKRNDHRHHAMDALTIAFTKPAHIQYLNNLAAKSDKTSSIYGIMQKETVRTEDGRIFIPPMPLDELRAAFKKELESILVSIKAKNKVVTRNVNRSKKRGGFNTKVELTPRGALHKETVYGKRRVYETYEKTVDGKMTAEAIASVASQRERNALLARLAAFGGDPKKAFTGANSLDKNPVFVDDIHSRKLDKKVRCVRFKEVYSVRKNIDPSLNIEKVLDARVKAILKERLQQFGGNAAKAFSNLDDNPIWINKEKGICLKRVTIAENFEELQALHEKKDNMGRFISDEEGKKIPADYVNLRNNHHIAIYQDAEGNYAEKVVSFFEALERVSKGLKPVDKDWRRDEDYKFLFSMKINEMFVFPNPETGFYPEEIDLKDKKNYSMISPNLYRVQKLSSMFYVFRHHLETTIADIKNLQGVTWKSIRSPKGLKGVVKVRINHIGEIVSVGEYD